MSSLEASPVIEKPFDISQQSEPTFRPLHLDEAIQIALTNSTVLRDLGGTVMLAPGGVRTIHGPAIQETDPRFGVEAALSAFDAQLAASAFFEENDRVINNQLLGGGTNLFQQDLAIFQAQISKKAATGSEFAIRHNVDYDANNADRNLFPSVWNANLEMEVRQPLLRGATVPFNRIAGPSDVPGVYNGVMVARVNTDISRSDFELGLRDFVSNVENAYWDLYYAYRDLDAKRDARNRILGLLQIVRPRVEEGLPPAEIGATATTRWSDRLDRLEEHYFRLQQEVQNALGGRLVEGTQPDSGSRAGTFRGAGGVYVAERRLRLMIGLPISDGCLLRPTDEPPTGSIVFAWPLITQEALERRVELQRQRLHVKRRAMELAASRNFALPRLDVVGMYRFRGFGDDLLHPDRSGKGRFDNAYMDLTGGDFQEWQLGLEFSSPIGSRRAHSAIRNAELHLARERAVLREQERQVIHDLSNALADLHRAHEVAKTAYNRRNVACRQVTRLQEMIRERERGGPEDVDVALDAILRAADAESQFFRAVVEYALAVKNVHFEKGSLLDYNQCYFLDHRVWDTGATVTEFVDRRPTAGAVLNYVMAPWRDRIIREDSVTRTEEAAVIEESDPATEMHHRELSSGMEPSTLSFPALSAETPSTPLPVSNEVHPPSGVAN